MEYIELIQTAGPPATHMYTVGSHMYTHMVAVGTFTKYGIEALPAGR